MTVISSRSNPKVKQVRALRQRKTRQTTGLFLVEGIRHVGEAVAAGADIHSILYAPDLLESPFAQALVDEQCSRGIDCYATTPEVFQSLAEKENPQGIVAVIRRPGRSLVDLHPDNFAWGVALVAPQDPGNVGTILRTLDAVGANGLLLLGDSVDPTHPSAVRASMGSLFWYPVIEAAFADFEGWVKQHHYHVYGTSAHGSRDYLDIPHYSRPRILLMGSEREGLSPDQATICEELVRLPMLGRTTSINLAVATGIFLYHMLSQD